MSDNNFMLPKIDQVTSDETAHFSIFRIEPLEPGFGTTMGNAMRRVLLSSLPGAAITQIKMNSIFHEFADIPNVKEDTTELILNIKQVRIRLLQDRPARLLLEATGPGRITAADIICPPDVEIVNPEQHIATLDSQDARLSIEFTVERGRGYTPADAHENLPIGVIPIDAIYTPIRRVNYHVENTRVGQQTDFDRLTLEVWTDGSIAPSEAVSQSAQILIRHLNLFAELGGQRFMDVARPATGIVPVPTSVAEMAIEELELSVRAYNCLKRSGITKVGRVLQMTEDDLLSVRNFGRKSLDELREKLRSRGLLESSRLAPVGSSDELGVDTEMADEDEDEELSGASLRRGGRLDDLDEDDTDDEETDDEDAALVSGIFGNRAATNTGLDIDADEDTLGLEDDLGDEVPFGGTLQPLEDEEEARPAAGRRNRSAVPVLDMDEGEADDDTESDFAFDFDEEETEGAPQPQRGSRRTTTRKPQRRERRTNFYEDDSDGDYSRTGRRR